MQVLPTALGGIIRLKIEQKSLGVIKGKSVGPKAMFGSLGLFRRWKIGNEGTR